MTTRTKKIDHGFKEIKWLIRKRLLSMITPRRAVDFYAGQGKILSSLYCGFQRIYAIEKDPKKWSLLVRNLDENDLPVMPYCMDNLDFIRTRLSGIEGINLMDFDAYGNPHPVIRQAFEAFTPNRRTVIAVTDGGWINLCRGRRVRLENYKAAPTGPGLSLDSTIAKIHPLVVKEYELLLRSFWRELAEKHGFTIKEFMSAWANGRRVIYYGVCIEPN